MSLGTMGSLKLVDQVLGDATAVGGHVALAAGPLTDGLVLLSIAAGLDRRTRGVALLMLLRVLVGKVDGEVRGASYAETRNPPRVTPC